MRARERWRSSQESLVNRRGDEGGKRRDEMQVLSNAAADPSVDVGTSVASCSVLHWSHPSGATQHHQGGRTVHTHSRVAFGPWVPSSWPLGPEGQGQVDHHVLGKKIVDRVICPAK